MNHDATHCADYRKSYCPKKCYRAKLTRDLFERKARGELAGIPMSFAHLRGTNECPRSKEGRVMGVYIPCLKMPKRMPIKAVIFQDGRVTVTLHSGKMLERKAVPVQTHGDLIERNTAKLYHRYLMDESTGIRIPAIPICKLNDVPTIIPAEEGET